MKTRDELKKELEADAEVLRKYLSCVSIVDDETQNTMSVMATVWAAEIMIGRFRYKPPFPPKGEVCLCWDDDEVDGKRLNLSLGNGRGTIFPENLRDSDSGVPWQNWKSLGVNVLDEKGDEL